MRRLHFVVLASIVWTACSGNPIGPAVPTVDQHIRVSTVDTAGQPLAHVALEVTDNRGQSQLIVTDSQGRAILPVPPVDCDAWLPGYDQSNAHITSSSFTFVLSKGDN